MAHHLNLASKSKVTLTVLPQAHHNFEINIM